VAAACSAPLARAAAPTAQARVHAALEVAPWLTVAEPEQDAGIAPPARGGSFTGRLQIPQEADPCTPPTSRRPAFVPLRN
jgi:hypothetical protein